MRQFPRIAILVLLVVVSVVGSPQGRPGTPAGTSVSAIPSLLPRSSASPAKAEKLVASNAYSSLRGVSAKPVRARAVPAAVVPPPPAAPPNGPVLFSPGNGTSGASVSPTLDVTVTDPAGSNLAVTFYGKVANTVGQNFTIIVLPDTQYYAATMNGGTPAMFNTQAQWIVNNKTALNIPYVISVGDMVQTGNNNGNDVEWIVADGAYKILEAAGIPYGPDAGNHDEGDNLSNLGSASITQSFNKWFGISRFTGRAYYGGHFGTLNDNHYDLFSAGGMDFIAIYFSYDESPSGSRFQGVLTWADGILKQYSNRHAILVSHYILDNGNPATFGAQGQILFNALKNNPNVFLTLSGHIGFPGEGYRSDTVSGNVIQSAMSDYQDRSNGGNGWLRIMQFAPASNQISVQTYTPVANQNMTGSSSQFTMAWNMAASGYTNLGTVSNVLSGAHATMNWNGLASGTAYQWYAVVTNGATTTTGPTWSFTTASTASPAVSLSSTSLAFGSQLQNTSSVPQNVMLTNSGNATLNLSSIVASSDYSETDTCGSSVAVGANCTITVTFTPTKTGTDNGSVTITDNASGSPHAVNLTGTGTAPAPVVNLSPTSLTFSSQLQGTTSAPQTFRLTNTGNANLTYTSIVASGDFAQTNDCSSPIAANAFCTISVKFTPTAAGTRTGAVTITDNASGSPHAVNLTGTGTAPAVSLSATTLNFGTQTINTASTPQSSTLTNSGTAALAITSIVASADYTDTTTCGATLNPGANCSISVTFTPTVNGTDNGTITITDSASGSPHKITLNGAGSTSAVAPAVTLSTGSLTFASQQMGTTSGAQSVQLSNTGNGTLNITSLVASGDYAQTNTCGTTVLPGANCSISVTFTPAAAGTRTGAVTITDNAAGSPHSINLTGTGTAAVIKYIQSASTSSSSATLLSKAFSAATTQNNLIVVGVYTWGGTVSSVTDTLANSYLPATVGTTPAGNRLYVYYAINKSSGADTVTVNLSGGGVMSNIHEYSGINTTTPLDQKLVSTGTGTTINSGNVTILVPNELIFGYAGVDGNAVTGPGTTYTLRQNTGNGELSEDKIVSTAGAYNATATCPSTTWAGAIVTFAGGATATAPAVTFQPTSLTFLSQPTGTTSASQSFTMTNTGTAPLTFTTIAASGDYAQTNNCVSPIAVNGTCTVNVTFSPTAVGTRTGAVAVTDNAPASPQQVTLSGTGTAPAPVVSLVPGSLTFLSQALNTASTSQSVKMTNTGNANLTFTTIVASGDFAQTNDCVSPIAANAFCTLTVTFTPTAAGTRTGAVTITDNASGSPHAVTLSGTGTAPAPVVSLAPASLNFGSLLVGTTSGTQSVTLTNTGNATLNISSIVPSGDYADTTTCGATLAASANCSITVTFTPTTTGTRNGAITITDNASGSPHSITLTGNGTSPTAPAVTLSPTSLTFAARNVGTTSGSKSVTLKNTGTASLSITNIVATGDFSRTTTCGSSLSAGSSCTISVRFKPTATGTRTGAITITDNANNSPQKVSLSGTGR
jgi:hypothetical protein